MQQENDLNNLTNSLKLDSINYTNLKMALTHSSYINENNISNQKDNERLEFLGDAVLKLASSKYLYNHFPHYNEGKLSKIRSILVSDATLFEFAISIDLQKYIKLGANEEKNNGRNRSSILSCAFEAFLGAIYLDFGEDYVYKFLNKFFINKVNEIDNNIDKYNAKATLQEYTQKINKTLPSYIIVNTYGSPHDMIFDVQVIYENKIIGLGRGKSKKEAEINAAYNACVNLNLIEDNLNNEQ